MVPGNILQFPGNIVGSALIRTVTHFFNVTNVKEALEGRPGFKDALGNLDVALSLDISGLRYTPQGGDSETIVEGTMFQIQSGSIYTALAITGFYNTEFFGPSGREFHLRRVIIINYSSYVNELRNALAIISVSLIPLFLKFS